MQVTRDIVFHFDDVKRAAVNFVNSLYFPYDRVSLVTFDKNASTVMNFSNDKADIINHIKALTVFQGDETATGPLIRITWNKCNISKWEPLAIL